MGARYSSALCRPAMLHLPGHRNLRSLSGAASTHSRPASQTDRGRGRGWQSGHGGTIMAFGTAQLIGEWAMQQPQTQLQCFAHCPAEARKVVGGKRQEGAKARQQRKRKSPASAETAAGEGCAAAPPASEAGPNVQAGHTLMDLAGAAAALAEAEGQ